MVIYLFPRGSNILIIVIDNKSLYMTVKTLKQESSSFFSFQKLLLKYLKLPTVNLPYYRYLSNCQLQSSFQLSRKQKSAEECEMQADVSKWGMEGRGVDVYLPLAFQAQRMPQSAKKITEHRSGAVAAATNTNGNPKSVYFCSCRCCCCRFLGSAALCCILQIQFKYKVSSLFFVFSPLSPDGQTDKQTASIWFKSLM